MLDLGVYVRSWRICWTLPDGLNRLNSQNWYPQSIPSRLPDHLCGSESKVDPNRRADPISMLRSLKRSIPPCASRVPPGRPSQPPVGSQSASIDPQCPPRAPQSTPIGSPEHPSQHPYRAPRGSQSTPSGPPERPSQPPVGSQSASVDPQCPPRAPQSIPIGFPERLIRPPWGPNRVPRAPQSR